MPVCTFSVPATSLHTCMLASLCTDYQAHLLSCQSQHEHVSTYPCTCPVVDDMAEIHRHRVQLTRAPRHQRAADALRQRSLRASPRTQHAG